MKIAIFLQLLIFSTVAQDATDEETYGPHCFSETDTFGVSFAAGATETASSDKNELDNIAISDYTFDARVTAIKFCTDLRTNYLSSV